MEAFVTDQNDGVVLTREISFGDINLRVWAGWRTLCRILSYVLHFFLLYVERGGQNEFFFLLRKLVDNCFIALRGPRGMGHQKAYSNAASPKK